MILEQNRPPNLRVHLRTVGIYSRNTDACRWYDPYDLRQLVNLAAVSISYIITHAWSRMPYNSPQESPKESPALFYFIFRSWFISLSCFFFCGFGLFHLREMSLTSLAALRVTRRYCVSHSTRIPGRAMTTTTTKKTTKTTDVMTKEGEDKKVKRAGKWLMRMAPPRGGTEFPDTTFLFVAAIVCGAGYYAWFIEPPSSPPFSSAKQGSREKDGTTNLNPQGDEKNHRVNQE